MNTYQISIHIRKFKRIPPVGTYFNLGVGEGLGIILLPHGVQLGWGGRGGGSLVPPQGLQAPGSWQSCPHSVSPRPDTGCFHLRKFSFGLGINLFEL